MRDRYVLHRYQLAATTRPSDVGDIFAINPIRRSLAAILISLGLIVGPLTFMRGDAQVAVLLATSWFSFSTLVMCIPVLLISLLEEGWNQLQRRVWPTIDELDLSPRARHLLHRHGFVTIGKVERTPDGVLLLLSNMDSQTLHEIRRSVNLYRYQKWQENGFR